MIQTSKTQNTKNYKSFFFNFPIREPCTPYPWLFLVKIVPACIQIYAQRGHYLHDLYNRLVLFPCSRASA